MGGASFCAVCGEMIGGWDLDDDPDHVCLAPCQRCGDLMPLVECGIMLGMRYDDAQRDWIQTGERLCPKCRAAQ